MKILTYAGTFIVALALATACAKGKGLSPAHLDKALEILLAADVKVVKAERLFAAIDAVRKGGLMLVIARGQPEFAAWLRHYEQTLPNMAALMAREGKWQVPSRWPPRPSASPRPRQSSPSRALAWTSCPPSPCRAWRR